MKIEIWDAAKQAFVVCDAVFDPSCSISVVPMEVVEGWKPLIGGRAVRIIRNGKIEGHQTYKVTVRIERSMDVLLTDGKLAFLGRDFLR
jgi:hypothetical protein